MQRLSWKRAFFEKTYAADKMGDKISAVTFTAQFIEVFAAVLVA